MSRWTIAAVVIGTLLVAGIVWWWVVRPDSEQSAEADVPMVSGDGGQRTENGEHELRPSTNIKAVEFTREGQVFANPRINNVEVIELASSSYRLFYHDLEGIKSADSTDGRLFTLNLGTVLRGQMSATTRLPGGSYRMYFSQDGVLKSATSTDGASFTTETGVRVGRGAAGSPDAASLIHPSLVALADGTYRMYYDGVSSDRGQQGPDVWRIMSARSADGLTWEKDPGIRIEPTGSDDPDAPVGAGDAIGDDDTPLLDSAFSSHVEYDRGTYTLYFTAETDPADQSGIWVATSTDGTSFTVVGPVLARDPKYGEGESQQASNGGPLGVPQDPFVLTIDGTERLFYWLADEGLFSAVRPSVE